MVYNEGVYTDKKFDITFDLKFSTTELFVYLEDHDVDIYMILSDSIKKDILDYVDENYSDFFEEMEEDHHRTMIHRIKNRI